jgi:hypothetical protein
MCTRSGKKYKPINHAEYIHLYHVDAIIEQSTSELGNSIITINFKEMNRIEILVPISDVTNPIQFLSSHHMPEFICYIGVSNYLYLIDTLQAAKQTLDDVKAHNLPYHIETELQAVTGWQ